jgi:hypothetical protein
MADEVIAEDIKAAEQAATGRRDKIISKTYYDKGGYGSIDTTLRIARRDDPKISKKQVQEWFALNIAKKANPTGAQGNNSFVAPYKGYEYQINLFVIKDLGKQKYKMGFIMIDIFTKYATVVPITNNDDGQLSLGIIQCLKDIRNSTESREA